MLLRACSGSMMPAIIIHFVLYTISYYFMIYSLHIIYLLFSTCSGSICVRRLVAAGCLPLWFIPRIYVLYLLIIYWSYLLIIYCSFIYYLVPVAAACKRRPAAAWCWPLCIIYLLFIYYICCIICLIFYLSCF